MSEPHQPKSDCEKAATMEPNSEHQTKTESSTNTAATQQQHAAASATAGSTPTTTTTNTTTNSTSTAPAVAIPKKSHSDFIFGKCIGEGSFSTVYLAIDKHSRREYAIKVCDKRHILRERKQEYVRREREVLQIMTNVPGFVKLMCTFQDTRSLYFVMTYAQNGELLPHIKRVGCFSVECARHYTAELVLACEQMHRRNVVHRDLKPENILLDKHMHTLIADFGSAKVLTPEDIAAAATFLTAEEKPSATKLSPESSTASLPSRENIHDDESDDGVSGSEKGVDDVDEFYRPQRFRHKRKGSFVGTAQYVSPEVLQNAPISPAADLWALGCILYQMISGLPPFRGYNDFAVFKEILACNMDFPENFDKVAEDLVRQLLKIKPNERLGSQDDTSQGGYTSIREHAFFAGIDFETLRAQTPPKIFPYLPSFSKDETDAPTSTELESELEKVLNLGATAPSENKFDLSADEKQALLEQQRSDKWHSFADNEVILKKGLVNKHKGLFSSKRMLLLTTGPHLHYIDPLEMIKAGEIPWGPELHSEVGNGRVFFIHTAERTYFFDVIEGTAQEWVLAIEKVHSLTYKEHSQKETVLDYSTPKSLSTGK